MHEFLHSNKSLIFFLLITENDLINLIYYIKEIWTVTCESCCGGVARMLTALQNLSKNFWARWLCPAPLAQSSSIFTLAWICRTRERWNQPRAGPKTQSHIQLLWKDAYDYTKQTIFRIMAYCNTGNKIKMFPVNIHNHSPSSLQHYVKLCECKWVLVCENSSEPLSVMT